MNHPHSAPPCRNLCALALLLALLPTVAGAQADITDATKAQKSAARTAFRAGRAAFDDGNLAAALEQFQHSFDQVQSPNSLLMVAKCQRGMGQPIEARKTFLQTQALADASGEARYAETSKVAMEMAAELDAQLGTVMVTVEGPAEGATLSVAGSVVPTEQWNMPVVVEPGTVQVTLSEGERQEGRTVTIGAGAHVEVTLTLPQPAPAAPAPAVVVVDTNSIDLRTVSHIVGGVGAAALLTAAITGAMSVSRYDDLEEGCNAQQRCPADLKDTANSGATLQTVANVTLVIGAVGVLAGVTIYVLSDESAGPELALSPGGIRLGGSF